MFKSCESVLGVDAKAFSLVLVELGVHTRLPLKLKVRALHTAVADENVEIKVAFDMFAQ